MQMKMDLDKKVLTAIKPQFGTTHLIGNACEGIHPVMYGKSYGTPTIDMNGSVDKLEIRKYSGGIEIIGNKDMLISRELGINFNDTVTDTIVFDRILNNKELEMLRKVMLDKDRETDPFSFYFGFDMDKPSNNTEWNFKSSSDSDINWKDLRDSVNYAEPLALVTRKYRDYDEVARYVVVSKELMDKAHNVGMFEATPSMIDKVSKRVFEIDNNFSDWVAWAKAVKSAKWTDSIKSTIKVILPTV